MKAGIVINDWKLAIFERHLRGAGLQWEQFTGPLADTLLLRVDVPALSDIEPIVRAANEECAES